MRDGMSELLVDLWVDGEEGGKGEKKEGVREKEGKGG